MMSQYSIIDFGKAVLQDQRTGDVYVDPDGNLVTIEGVRLVVQECVVALKTIIGEELFDSNWGFDLFAAITNPFLVDQVILLTGLVTQCLDPSKILQIKEAVLTNVEGPNDDNEIRIDVGITTLTGEDVTLTTSIGEMQ